VRRWIGIRSAHPSSAGSARIIVVAPAPIPTGQPHVTPVKVAISIVVEMPGIIAIGPPPGFAVEVAMIITVEPAGADTIPIARVTVEVPVSVAIEPAPSVMVAVVIMVEAKPTFTALFVALRLHFVAEFAYRAADVLRIGNSIGPHVMQDLAEANPGLMFRCNLIRTQRHSAVPANLRRHKCAGNHPLTRGKATERARVTAIAPTACGANRLALSPRCRDQQQAAQCSVDHCAAHGNLLLPD